MKITKRQLKQIIKEEFSSLKEVEYDSEGNPMYAEPQQDAPTSDDTEILVKGFGGLTIGQLKDRIKIDLSEASEAASQEDWRRVGSSRLQKLFVFLRTLEEHLGD
jgi:hypothetical protein